MSTNRNLGYALNSVGRNKSIKIKIGKKYEEENGHICVASRK
jgi:hypothetical protein